ncbi:MAG: glycosyltransferase family 9 protein [Candidatus Binatia bacterium]
MTSTAEPTVSVLVATRNRAPLLTQLLRSLELAMAGSPRAEILVVDNGSTDTTPILLADWTAAGRARVVLTVDQPGKSRALNCATGRARGRLLAFLDDDEQVATDWLREVEAFFDAHPEYDAGIGRVLPASEVTDPEILTRIACYRTIALFDHGDAVRDEHMLHGANMVLRRSVFDRVGGFNEQLGPGAVGGCEDAELGERVTRTGLRIGYMPGVRVYHAIDPARLTPEYFRSFELRTARSRFAMDPDRASRRAIRRVREATLAFAWWSLLRHPVRRERARGSMIRHGEILRLYRQRSRTAASGRNTIMSGYRHILVVRTDRMGDMIVTTPLFAEIKRAFPQCRLTVLASAAGEAVARAHPVVDAVEVDTYEAKGSGWRGTLSLAHRLRRLHCDAAVVVYSKHRLALAVWLARIPVRIGPGQRGYSFLYNRRVFQGHRRLPIRHETAYSLDLLRPLGIEPDPTARPVWQVVPADAAAVEALLARRGLAPGRSLVTIHPGCGGSSLNWTAECYAELADGLVAERGVAIAVTGGAHEAELVARMCAAMRAPALNLAGQLSVSQLAALMARSLLYVGSSTGPSHLAAAVGTPVLALFCPLGECLPERWRPQSEACTVLLPPVNQVCPTCLGARCRFFPCMELISPSEAARAAYALLDSRPASVRA